MSTIELRGSPSEGVAVEAGGTVVRAVAQQQLTTDDGRGLSPHGIALIKAARALIEA